MSALATLRTKAGLDEPVHVSQTITVRRDRDECYAYWRDFERFPLGAKVENCGSVRFVTAPADQGTEIHVELRYAPPAGAAGATIAKLLGRDPSSSVKNHLRRFKQIVETGEVAA